VQEKEDVKVYTSLASLCAGDSVQLQAQGADIYSWTPDASLNNATIANPMAYPAVNTTYIVTGKDRNACFSDTAMLDVIVHPKPFVNIADSIVQVLSGSTYQIQATASEDVRYWKWLPVNDISCFTCPQPVATVKNSIKYTVTVSNGFGCSNEDAINLVSLCSDQVLYVPNTFSPNGDGRNDYFFPRSNKDVFIKSFKIFNRWGQAVFEKMNFPSNNYAYGWNGKFKNADQQSDVYVYLMEVECANGNAVIKKGDVSLVR
jgi:gliding motility-associated-like protein